MHLEPATIHVIPPHEQQRALNGLCGGVVAEACQSFEPGGVQLSLALRPAPANPGRFDTCMV